MIIGQRHCLATPDWLAAPQVRFPSDHAAPASSRRGWRQEEPVPELDRPTIPMPIGRRSGQPIDIVFVIDDSGSTDWTDPQGWRYVAVRRIVNLLAKGVGGYQLSDRVGGVHFADTPSPSLALTRVSSKPGRARIRNFMRPISGGGTRIVPAIERGAQILGHSRRRDALVLLFTDGESGETSEQLQDAVRRVPAGSVHVVALAGQLPEQWNRVPLGSITALTNLKSADDLEWLIARPLLRTVGLEWVGPDQSNRDARPSCEDSEERS